MSTWAYVDTDSGNHCGSPRTASTRREAVAQFRQGQLHDPDEDIFLVEYDPSGSATKCWTWDNETKRVRST